MLHHRCLSTALSTRSRVLALAARAILNCLGVTFGIPEPFAPSPRAFFFGPVRLPGAIFLNAFSDPRSLGGRELLT
jgi:hypothetical protein